MAAPTYSSISSFLFTQFGQTCPSADPVEYEQADSGRQVAVLARLVDLCNRLRYRRTLGLRDFFQAVPERIFETDAGLLSINDNGAFDDCGFHDSPFDQRQFS